MAIFPLPQFEADLEADRKIYEEKLKAPKSMVVRFGTLKFIGEFPYDGTAKPGCGSKVVLKTHRGTELGEMLTSTCPNGGCDHALTRKDMLQYIENSGGKDYPFFTDGRVLRVATVDDLNKQSAVDSRKPELLKQARQINEHLGLSMKLVEVEPILGGEKISYYYASEERIDFRPLVMELAAIHHTRIEMKQVGARDEARITADYEKCGQHCCCKQFLKVLKPVSMRNAKIQKATLDPLKISGRCGRLMCCLRYEEASYDELRANLPKKKTRVLTPDGPGLVIDSQILTQLVLVALDNADETAAYPVESLKKYEGPAPSAIGDDEEGPAVQGRPEGRQEGRQQTGPIGTSPRPLPGGQGQSQNQNQNQDQSRNQGQYQGQRRDGPGRQGGEDKAGGSGGLPESSQGSQGNAGQRGQRPSGQQPGGQFRNRPGSNNDGGQPGVTPSNDLTGQGGDSRAANPQAAPQSGTQPRQPMSDQDRDRVRKMIPKSDFANGPDELPPNTEVKP